MYAISTYVLSVRHFGKLLQQRLPAVCIPVSQSVSQVTKSASQLFICSPKMVMKKYLVVVVVFFMDKCGFLVSTRLCKDCDKKIYSGLWPNPRVVLMMH